MPDGKDPDDYIKQNGKDGLLGLLKEKEIIQVSNWISNIINDFENEDLQQSIKEEVQNLTSDFPVYNV